MFVYDQFWVLGQHNRFYNTIVPMTTNLNVVNQEEGCSKKLALFCKIKAKQPMEV